MTQTATPAEILRGTWKLDTAHTGLEFSARHAMVATVRGYFRVFDGTLTIDPDDPGKSAVEVDVDAASVDTGNETRDDHLRSPDFLEVERFPRITFRSTRIERTGDEDLTLRGELTVRDVTREVELEGNVVAVAVDPFGNTRVGFEARGTISRKDWGLVWNAPLEAGGVLVSDKVNIILDVSAIKQP